ncbi:unnamed protein product [Protopolystoma xenopodis]|uniref:Uncharacterized protein n=1 Tax=Protopolystoma xenopodis TaxID=117903 RepID=A0A448WZE9_9PLAT|nr:unnamed protein product [Protopolystoma xenopodis]
MVGDNPSQPIASICRRSSISNVAKSSASPVSYNCKKKAAYVIWRSKPYSLAWWAPLTGTGLPNCLEPPTEALSKLHQEFSRQANYEKRMAGLIAAASARAQAERSLRFSRIRQGARALRTMLRQQQNRLQVFE